MMPVKHKETLFSSNTITGMARLLLKLKRTKQTKVFLSCLVAFLLGGMTGPVMALPEGGVVVGGQGAIQQADNSLLINQHSRLLAIDWDSFNIAIDEAVRFYQPSTSATVLNHIVGQSPSEIFGRIDANGRVFLANPNGIIFGQGSIVNVGSLLASGLNIDPDSFMNGDYRLYTEAGDSPGIVVNRGLLQAATGGSINLLGGAVANEGVIVAELGQVNLGSGRSAVLDFDGDGLIGFAVSDDIVQNLQNLESAVSNTGQIRADGGQVLMAATVAQDVFSQSVNNAGIIRANRIDRSGGKVRLVGTGAPVINSGSIDVSGVGDTDGGTVSMLGDVVGVIGNASIDASGPSGGGRVLIGGDYQGANPEVINASRTYIGPEASIRADATQAGDGGKVIVWADEVTGFYGDISARGGAESGNGGFVEVSGKDILDFDGTVDLGAQNGSFGTLLLDPATLTIVDAASGGDHDADLPDILSGAVDIGGNTVSWGAIDALGAAANVVLEASGLITISDITGAAGSGITSNDLVELDLAAGSLTISSTGGAIQFDDTNDVIRTEGGTITLQALGGDLILGGLNTTGAGGAQGGSVNLQAAGAVTQGAAITTTELSIINTGGDTTLTHAGNSFTRLDIDTVDSFDVSSTTTLTDLTLGLNPDGSYSYNLTAPGLSFSIDDPEDDLELTDITVGPSLSLNLSVSNNDADGNLEIGVIDVGAGTVTLNAGGDITDLDTDQATDISATTLIVTGAANVGDSGGNNDVDIDVASLEVVNVSGNLYVQENDAIDLDNVNVGGILNLTAGGNITDSGEINAGGTATFTGAGGSDILLDSASNSFGGTVSFAAVSGTLRDVHITDDTALELGAITLSRDLTVRAGGDLTDSGVLDIAGDASFITTQGNGSVILDQLSDIDGALSVTTHGTGTTSVTNLTDAIDLGTVNTTALTIAAAGSITDSGEINASGSVAFTAAGGSDILLDSSNNSFGGVVNFAAASGTLRDVHITDDTALELGAITLTRDLTINAGGAVTQNGDLNIAGITSVSAAGYDIDLDAMGNDFNGVSINGANVSLRDSNELSLGSSSVTGNLLLISGGAITQSGSLDIGGLTTVSAAGYDVDLDDLGNDFNGVSINAANVSLRDSNELSLGISSITGNLLLTSGGAITQSGSVDVSGLTTVSAAGYDVTLDDPGNDFTGVSIHAANVSLRDSNELSLGTSSITGNLLLTSGGAVTQSNAIQVNGLTTVSAAGYDITLDAMGNDFNSVTISGANATLRDDDNIDFASATLSGQLNVTAGGAITDSGVLTVNGNASFTGADGNDILLDTAGNNFGGIVILSAASGTLRDVTITDDSDLVLGALNLGRNLTLTAGGAVTQIGNFNIAGLTSVTASGYDITLDNAGNDFNNVSINGANVSLRDSNELSLGASSITGNFLLTSGGAVSQSDAIQVNGLATVSTPGYDITLDAVGNDFHSVAVSGANVTLRDNDNIDFAGSTINGQLNVTAGGAITDSGALTVNGNASFTGANGDDILLDTAGNNFNGAVVFTAATGTLRDVSIVDASALTLETLSLSRNLTVTAGGAVTQNGSLDVGGLTSVSATGYDITLDGAGNDFNNVSINGANVSLRDVDDISLGSLAITGKLSVMAAGKISLDVNGGQLQLGQLWTENEVDLDLGNGGQINGDNSNAVNPNIKSSNFLVSGTGDIGQVGNAISLDIEGTTLLSNAGSRIVYVGDPGVISGSGSIIDAGRVTQDVSRSQNAMASQDRFIDPALFDLTISFVEVVDAGVKLLEEEETPGN
ncbi:MAG: filamentous hemagglutinin N-terminal domain-containing protein [Gammaproteobacteria bacterium]|nr:filamentous hemagglutinin N-terminal domain-containing protein [Gammaproteobacteria bacterium]